MLYLNKFLKTIRENPTIFKSEDMIFKFGLTNTHIKELKKYALENQLITQEKQNFFLSKKGEEFLSQNPLESWKNEKYPLREDINVEYLKEEKTTAILTKAIRLIAKHLLENQLLKEFSIEHAVFEDIKKCKNLTTKIENDILKEKKVCLEDIFKKYLDHGLTKSIISVVILIVLHKNIEKIAIYEKSQFQLKFEPLMFDRMIACPQNFELQKTVIENEYLLKDISKIILNEKSNNILEITKGLYKTIKSLDKYTMNTQNLSKKTLRFRNVIVNAKDPMSLFKKDIPKSLGFDCLENSDREFLNNLKNSLNELKNCTNELVKDLEKFFFNTFHAKSKEDLCKRFLAIKEYIGEKELKILLNSVVEIDVSNDLWIKRIATFINKSRVPKDWSDEDYADFKIKTKELALKFFVLEATVGTDESCVTQKYHNTLNSFLKLSKQEQLILLRKAIIG